MKEKYSLLEAIAPRLSTKKHRELLREIEFREELKELEKLDKEENE